MQATKDAGGRSVSARIEVAKWMLSPAFVDACRRATVKPDNMRAALKGIMLEHDDARRFKTRQVLQILAEGNHSS